MSETVRENIRARVQDANWVAAYSAFVDEYGDYHMIEDMIEGGLVSPEMLERCAKRLCKHVCVQRGGNPESAWRVQADQYRAEALAVLSAAGYEQWDEAVTVAHYLSILHAEGSVHGDPGDILYIKRKEDR